MPSEFQCKELPLPLEFQFKECPLPSELQKFVHRGVWIFSGIAQLRNIAIQKFLIALYDVFMLLSLAQGIQSMETDDRKIQSINR